MKTVQDNFSLGMKQMKLNRSLGAIRADHPRDRHGRGALGRRHADPASADAHRRAAGRSTAGSPSSTIRRCALVDFNVTLQWAGAALERVFETLDTRPEITDVPERRRRCDSMQGAVESQST